MLVLRGEAGIGKSALLDYAAERAKDCRVLRGVGVEWEMELAFAGVHQLCSGLLDGRERLAEPQKDAIATAFGLSSGPQPDRFLVGLAVLGLLSDAAEERPLVCIVDDVQWLDRSSAQVLAFVARRLGAESVVVLFAEREPSRLEELAGLPALQVGGLSDASARELLASVITAPLDERVRARILAETRGNPLALLELPREISAKGFAGGFELPSEGSLPGRIEASFRRRVQQLPTETQRLLLVAAADPTGEPALLVRASEEIGVPIHQLSPAEADELLELGLQVTFRHPLLRSAVYRSASRDERRAAHQALAAATDPGFDPDRRAWHRAHAIAEPVEDVAFELEQSADARSRARRTRSGRCVLRAIGGAHARPDPPGPPRAGSGNQQAPGRRLPGSIEAARERGRRAAGPIGSCQAEAPARRDRDGSERAPQPRCRCCLTRPGSSNRSTFPFRVTRTWPRCEPQASPAGSARGRSRSHARHSGRPRPDEPRAVGPARRRAGGSVHRRLRRRRARAETCAQRTSRGGRAEGGQRPLAVVRPTRCGGAVRGRHLALPRPPERFNWRARLAPSACSRSR